MIVLDASVVLKWILRDEDGATRALEFRERHLSGTETIAVPELLFYEVGNTMVWSRRLTDQEAEASWEGLRAVALDVYSLRSHGMLRAMALARNGGLSVYDATYIALAERLECDLVTADIKLARKLHGQEIGCVVHTL